MWLDTEWTSWKQLFSYVEPCSAGHSEAVLTANMFEMSTRSKGYNGLRKMKT